MKSVIVIEDDTDMANSMSSLLELCDIDVLGKARDGKLGFELLQKIQPDAILLDIMMPNYDGFYLLEKIRESNSNVMSLVVTGDSKLETKKKLSALKPTAVFYKPIEIEQIVQLLE